MIQKTVKAAKLVVRFTALAKPLAFFKVKLAKVQKPIKRKVPVPGPYIPSYIPTNKEDYEWKERYYDHIFLPDGVEDGPQRFAITRRNRWMALNCDYMICYVKNDYGGAYAAMKVALANKKEVINICQA